MQQYLQIIQATHSQDNSIQLASDAYINMLLQNPEELAQLHFESIRSGDEATRNSSLVLFSRYFSLLSQYDIKAFEKTYSDFQSNLLSLFLIEHFSEFQLDNVSHILFKAAKYFQNNWPGLTKSLCDLLKHQNPLISSNVAQCLSNCIDDNLIDARPYFEYLVGYIQNYLATPNESSSDIIVSNLRLFYSLAKLIDQYLDLDHQIAIFSNAVNYIPNCMCKSQNDPRIINDFFIFYKSHQNLFSGSYQKYYEVLMSIISNPDFCYATRSSSIYTLCSIISRYSEGFKSEVIGLFNAFSKLLYNDETFEDASEFLQNLSEIYGGDPQYAQYLYQFFQSNLADPYAFVSFGISFKGIKDHFANSGISKILLDNFSQGFTSKEDSARYLFFYSFDHLVSIFHQSEANFSSEEAINAILKAIVAENNDEILTLQVKILSQLLKFYSSQFSNLIPEIINLLDNLISRPNKQQVIVYILKCYKYLALSYKENLLPFSELIACYFIQILDNPQQSKDLFFYFMEELPYFKFSFPQEIYNNLISNLSTFLFKSFDDNGNEIGSEELSLLDNGTPSLISFFLNSLKNESIINSPDFLQKIINISLNVFSNENRIEIINDSDIDLSECCKMKPIANENKVFVIGNEQIFLFQNALSVLYLIFKQNTELLIANLPPLYELITDLLQSLLSTYFFSSIFDLEIIMLPFIQDEIKLSDLAEYTLQLDSIYEFNLLDLVKLSELISAFIKIVLEKPNVSILIISTISSFILHLLVFLDHKNDELMKTAQIINNITYDNNIYFPTKINFALVLREIFRYYPQISNEYFKEYTFNIVYGMQERSEPNKIIASIIFSDFSHFCSQINSNYSDTFITLFKSYLQSQDQQIRFSAIYGLSIIMNPNNTDTQTIEHFFNNLIRNTQNDHNDENRSMVIFAFLQLFQNYSATYDTAHYLLPFWELFIAANFQMPVYCIEYFSQSLFAFLSKNDNQVPTEKLSAIKILIQKLLDTQIFNPFYEPLNSLLGRLQP